MLTVLSSHRSFHNFTVDHKKHIAIICAIVCLFAVTLFSANMLFPGRDVPANNITLQAVNAGVGLSAFIDLVLLYFRKPKEIYSKISNATSFQNANSKTLISHQGVSWTYSRNNPCLVKSKNSALGALVMYMLDQNKNLFRNSPSEFATFINKLDNDVVFNTHSITDIQKTLKDNNLSTQIIYSQDLKILQGIIQNHGSAICTVRVGTGQQHVVIDAVSDDLTTVSLRDPCLGSSYTVKAEAFLKTWPNDNRQVLVKRAEAKFVVIPRQNDNSQVPIREKGAN